MNIKSKKGMTLIEMVISIALIALVSIALLGILVPAANIEKDSKKTNVTTFLVSEHLERALFSMQSSVDISDAQYVTYEDHDIRYTLNGTDFSCAGKLVRAKQPGNDLSLYAFYPAPPAGE